MAYQQVRYLLFILLIQVCLVTVHEFVHTSGCINQLHLTRIEGVRSTGNLQFDQRVLNTIFKFYSLFGRGCRFGYEGESIGHILGGQMGGISNELEQIGWFSPLMHVQ